MFGWFKQKNIAPVYKFSVGDEIEWLSSNRGEKFTATIEAINDNSYYIMFSDKSGSWRQKRLIEKYYNLTIECYKRKKFSNEMKEIINE